jgi:F-type H+-transporting ATPase subunit gamma
VSRRRDLQQKLKSLGEIEGIMTAMKNLAFMETRKLAQFLAIQQRAVASIDAAAADFAACYSEFLPQAEAVSEAFLLVGSERGLCGDFNERMMDAMEAHIAKGSAVTPIVAVGRRLEARLDGHDVAALLEGPNVVEEVEAVLGKLSRQLVGMMDMLAPGTVLGLTAFFHGGDNGEISVRRLLPLSLPAARSRTSSPQLNIPPADFFAQFIEHYLYAALHEMFYSSLMVENRFRLEHMDRAVHQLGKQVGQLKLRYNALRQEEIIEEIEVIMLSAETLVDTVS